MYNIIEKYSKENDLLFGIINAETLEPEFSYNNSLFPKDLTKTPFFSGTAQSRVNPNLLLDNGKSIIVLGINSFCEPLANLTGIIPKSLSSIDYHIRLKVITRGLIEKMLEKLNFTYKIQIDTGPLYEKGFAIKAGLGFMGRNNLVINERFGSFFNIALIVTDIEFNHKELIKSPENLCYNCMLCVNNCPAKALSVNGSFSYELCASYITQKKALLSYNEMCSIGVSIYGCDICQKFCPHNNKIVTNIDPMEINKNLINILNMPKKDYDRKFKGSNFYWRGRTTILRNALISLYNTGDRSQREVFHKFTNSQNELLKQHAKLLLSWP